MGKGVQQGIVGLGPAANPLHSSSWRFARYTVFPRTQGIWRQNKEKDLFQPRVFIVFIFTLSLICGFVLSGVTCKGSFKNNRCGK